MRIHFSRFQAPAPLLVGASCLLAVSFLPGISNAQSPPPDKATLRFTGEVHRGQRFEKDIGRGLVFRLDPDDNGWNIEVGPAGSTDDYTDCVNMPAHGITNRQIQGWHFRNDDNTAPLEPRDFQTPGIGQPRQFDFVLTAEDQSKSCDDLSKGVYWWDEKNPEHQKALARWGTLAAGEGTLTLTAMKLGNLVRGQQAWIDSMKFEVSISFSARRGSKKTGK